MHHPSAITAAAGHYLAGGQSGADGLSDWLPALLAALASAFVPLITAVYQSRNSRQKQSVELDELKTLIEVYNQVPEGNDLRGLLTEHIELRVKRLNVEVATVHDPLDLGLGSVFALMGAGLVYLALRHGDHWYWLLVVAAAMIIIGVTGLADGFRKEDKSKQESTTVT